MADEFFDDEQELMEAAGSAPSTARTDSPQRGSAAGQPAAPAAGREAPPFWMVVAIALIALVLGVVIGYLIGTSTAYSALEAAQSVEMTDTASDTDSSTSMLPEGHPELSIDEDGTATVVEGDGTDA